MGRWLVNLRIVMYILISLIYFFGTSAEESGTRIFIGIAILLFVTNHIYQFYYNRGKLSLAAINVDGLISFVFAFVFPGSTLYFILVGVTTITLFITEASKKKLRIYVFIFLIFWSCATGYSYYLIGQIPIFQSIVNVSFVVFGAVVGNLIRRLLDANLTVSQQYEQLNESHSKLSTAHHRLTQYSHQLEQLTLIRERNRIAREIHDTVGHKMTALLVQLELAKELIARDEKKSRLTLDICDELARSALEEIRFSVKTLEKDTTESISFIQSVRKILEDFHQSTGFHSVLECEGDSADIPASLQLTIIRVIQETLTNAKRHSTATAGKVHIECFPDIIKLHIEDNGIGTNSINPGFGLRNMKERVKEQDGTVRFESREGEGFHTFMEFSISKKQWFIGGGK